MSFICLILSVILMFGGHIGWAMLALFFALIARD